MLVYAPRYLWEVIMGLVTADVRALREIAESPLSLMAACLDSDRRFEMGVLMPAVSLAFKVQGGRVEDGERVGGGLEVR